MVSLRSTFTLTGAPTAAPAASAANNYMLPPRKHTSLSHTLYWQLSAKSNTGLEEGRWHSSPKYRGVCTCAHSSHAYDRDQEPKSSPLAVSIYQCINVSIGKKKICDPQTNQFQAKIATANTESIKKSLVQNVCPHPLTRRDKINVKHTRKGKHLLYKHSSPSLQGMTPHGTQQNRTFALLRASPWRKR